eukprot:2111716-Pleurochrysis_carterae.AAC.1
MAIVDKQELGTAITCQGVRLHAALGIAFVPEDKRRRAIAALRDTIHGSISVEGCRSLLGLLESLLFVASMRKADMFGMYTPFRPDRDRVPAACINDDSRASRPYRLPLQRRQHRPHRPVSPRRYPGPPPTPPAALATAPSAHNLRAASPSRSARRVRTPT